MQFPAGLWNTTILKMLSRPFCNQKIVMFKGKDARIAALEDTC